MLNARGGDQLFNQSQLALFRAANCRLQARQMLSSQEPEPVQEELIGQLDANVPDVRIAIDIMQMSRLCSEARSLLQSRSDSAAATLVVIMQIDSLLDRMDDLLAAVLGWTSGTNGIWKPKVVDAYSLETPEFPSDTMDHPLRHYNCPRLLSYPDVWFAYIWNFHAASQILFRETRIKLTRYRASLEEENLIQNEMELELIAVEKLTSTIISSLPPLLGFANQSGEPPASTPQGVMAGRFLALFALDVVRNASYACPEHKLVASEVVDWIKEHHSLQ